MSLIFSATLAFEAVGANVAQGTARVNPVIVRSRVAKKRSGTLRTASLPVDWTGWIAERKNWRRS